MSTYKITIPYTPKEKGSWRLGRHGTYNPSCKGMLKTKLFVKKHLEKNNLPLLTGPLLVIAHYRIPAPKALSARKRALQNLFPHIKKPDGDNLEKFLNDALNGVLWDDDARITWLLRSKTLCNLNEGQTIIFVKELEQSVPDYDALLNTIAEHIRIEEAEHANIN